MRAWTVAAAALALAGYASVVTAFPWNKDMVDQPSPKPQTTVTPPPPGSVPTTGLEIVPRPGTEAEVFAGKEAAAGLPNPVPSTPASVARGADSYATYCAICHGAQGRGDGPVGLVFEPSPVDLHEDYTQEQTDGQIYFTITRGRIEMPQYRDALRPEERWDLVNFLRAAFGNGAGAAQ
jgi:S-disulfanyl-L-cysteine oxidoreductase SoxD